MSVELISILTTIVVVGVTLAGLILTRVATLAELTLTSSRVTSLQ